MAKKKKQQRAGSGSVASQNSIDSINDTIVTQPKPSTSASEKPLNGTVNTGGSIAPSGSSVSSFERNPIIPPSMAPSTEEPPYEPYRPPPILSHERINPFDKNKAPTFDNKTSGIYSSLSLNTPPAPAQVVTEEKKEVKPVEIPEPSVKPAAVSSFSTTSGFDYSYKPPVLPTFTPTKAIVVKQDSKSKEEVVEKREPSRHKFERKLSDADIIFGSKPEPYTSSFKFENYSRNRSNSSFTSTSTDSDYVYGSRDARKDNPFNKSLSVSSDKDGDFTHDPSVLDSRAYQGISNDAFSDYDSPKTTASVEKKAWSNNDDDLDDLK